MPIQNRVNMLATGVNTMIGVRVLGGDQESIRLASGQVAEILKTIPGATDVTADPTRGKGYLEIKIDRDKAARLGVDSADVNDSIKIALAGKVATTAVQGRTASQFAFEPFVRVARTSRPRTT